MNKAEHAAFLDETAAKTAARNQRFRDLFNTPLGKVVLVDFALAAGLHLSDDPGMTHGELAYKAGQRNIVMWAFTNIDDGPEGVAERLRFQKEML